MAGVVLERVAEIFEDWVMATKNFSFALEEDESVVLADRQAAVNPKCSR